MKKILITIFLCAVTLSVFSQTKINGSQKDQIVAKVEKYASSVSSMKCSFVQTKSMKMLSKQMQSKGVMYFKRPNKLRWQYTSPYDYTFIMNANNVRLKSAKTSQTIDTQKNKMFKQITNVIVSSITGGCLKSSSDFTFDVYSYGNTYSAKLYPKKKEIKQIYTSIEIFFNSSLTMVSSVKMYEKSGDVTVVKLNDVQTNCSIDEKVFSIN